MSLVGLWKTQDRTDEAGAALSQVYGRYTEGFATPDLIDAAALLAGLS